jgi:hypothetical protein
MKKIDTIGDQFGKKLFIEKLAAGYNPTPNFHPLDLWFIYKFGKLPKKLKKLHHIYTLELTAE